MLLKEQIKKYCQTPDLGLGLGVDFTFPNNNKNNNKNKLGLSCAKLSTA